MSNTNSKLIIILSADDILPEELDNLAYQLKTEISDLNVQSVEKVLEGSVQEGAKAADWASIGQIAVTLAPTVIPPLFELLKSWIERKSSSSVNIRVKVGKKTAQIEYDPTKTSPKELQSLIKSLKNSLRK
jgi:hypothetical protein